MDRFMICLAGIVVEICPLYPEIRSLCREYLCDMDMEPEFRFATTKEDILYEKAHADGDYPEGYLETLAVYRKIAAAFVERDILLLHGSAVAVDGRCYIFTAPSGTGKSTHTALWRSHFGDRAVMINDDKPLIRLGRDEIRVYGTPWNGKHHLGSNISAPLCGICSLKRGEENRIRTMDRKRAFPILLGQIYRPYEDAAKMHQVLNLTEQLLKVPVYELECTISEEAVITAYETMRGGESYEIKRRTAAP